jgi:hypothetical protein
MVDAKVPFRCADCGYGALAQWWRRGVNPKSHPTMVTKKIACGSGTIP